MPHPRPTPSLPIQRLDEVLTALRANRETATSVLVDAAVAQLTRAKAELELAPTASTPLLRDLAVFLDAELRWMVASGRVESAARDARRLLGRVNAELDERHETALDAIGRAAS